MTTPSLKEQIIAEIDKLSPEQQQHILTYAKTLGQRTPLPPGIPGEVWLARMNSFEFEPGELEEMARVIEEECERIDWDEWA